MVNHTEGTNLAIAAACGRVGFNSVNDRPRPSSMGVEEFATCLKRSLALILTLAMARHFIAQPGV